MRAGEWGEDEAARLLKKKGYKILGRRVRIGRRDELDIVARLKDRLVFVEVKTRRNIDYGRPITSVDRDKKRTVSRAAIRYMMDLKERPKFFRFDVIEVVGTPDDGVKDIQHLENAFPLDKKYRVPW